MQYFYLLSDDLTTIYRIKCPYSKLKTDFIMNTYLGVAKNNKTICLLLKVLYPIHFISFRWLCAIFIFIFYT